MSCRPTMSNVLSQVTVHRICNHTCTLPLIDIFCDPLCDFASPLSLTKYLENTVLFRTHESKRCFVAIEATACYHVHIHLERLKFFVHTLHVLGNCYNLGSIIEELVKRFCDLLATNGYFSKKSHLNITVYPNYTKIKFSKLHPDKLGIETNIC